VQDGDVRVVNLSEHQLTVRSIMANDDRSVSTIPLPELKPPHANRAGKMAGCVSGSDGFIYCLIHGNMSSTILVYRGDSVKPAYYEIPEIEPDWKLIGAMDDFIIWQPSSGKLVRFGGHTL